MMIVDKRDPLYLAAAIAGFLVWLLVGGYT